MCDKCNHQEWLNDIDDMLLDEDYSFAENTLSGIKDWVESNDHITPRQCESVENIKNGGKRYHSKDNEW